MSSSMQLEEEKDGVRWPPACEDVIPVAEERSLLEDVTKQSSQYRDWELVFVQERFMKCSHELYECPIYPITNPNYVYRHLTRDNM
jgi:hypothetical protein